MGETRQFRDSTVHAIKRLGISLPQLAALGLYYGLAKHLPDPPMPTGALATRLRTALAKAIFREVGRDVKVHRNVVFGNGRHIAIGDFSAINSNSWIACDTTIGMNVMFGPEVIILSGGHEVSRIDVPMRLQGATERRPVIIGDDVWIGTRAIILPGVQVGSHSIIGAGAVVTKSVDEWAIVAGNPARKVGDRRDRFAGQARLTQGASAQPAGLGRREPCST